MKLWISGIVLMLFMAFPCVYAQETEEIMTAEKFLEQVGQRYGTIKDYEARITILSGSTEMFGMVMHRAPSLMRIDFTKPEEQVISFNGEVLTVYLPEYRAVLSQSVSSNKKASGASLASAQGLNLLQRNYTVAFVENPIPKPLYEGSEELVIKLILTRRSASEGFKELFLDVNPDTLLIRRIEGITIAEETVSFEFSDIKLDQNIPEARFIYDSPASANMYYNFLFKDAD